MSSTFPLPKTPSWLGEFRAFIMRGSVVDLAVGIIIGAAFTGVVNEYLANIPSFPVQEIRRPSSSLLPYQLQNAAPSIPNHCTLAIGYRWQCISHKSSLISTLVKLPA